MQLLRIESNTKLIDLANRVGARNVDAVLHQNNLNPVVNVGSAYHTYCTQIQNQSHVVDWQRKYSVLNKFTSDSDIFEAVALAGSSAWKVVSATGTLPGYLYVPETVPLPPSTDLLGNGQPVSEKIYAESMEQLKLVPHTIEPSTFNEYSSMRLTELTNYQDTSSSNIFEAFHLPWGEVTLYSSLSDEYMDIPVYPESTSDSVKANYTTMPDTLYQYEPWQIYQSSGARANSYVFNIHRDMWNGDHRDGRANALIRFCEANCYPEYNGSAVNTSLVTLFIKGKALIRGIMTDVSTEWDGPIGLDGWYLSCRLTLNITEVASQPLSYTTIKNKGIIGD